MEGSVRVRRSNKGKLFLQSAHLLQLDKMKAVRHGNREIDCGLRSSYVVG
jgi:hypothetical protein